MPEPDWSADARGGLHGIGLATEIAGRRLTEAQTSIGWLWLDEADVLVRPAIERSGEWSPEISAISTSGCAPG